VEVKQKLIKDGFFVLPKFITVEQAKNLFFIYKNCEAISNLVDIQVPNCTHSIVNFRPFLELLCAKNIDVANLLGEMVFPTYTYARIYKHGNILEKHLDRPACEISLSVHLQGDKEWPIYMEKPTGEAIGVVLRPGDAILYLGCDTPHWRDAYDGEEYGQVFLHYVLSNGKYWDNCFDTKHAIKNFIASKLEMEPQ